MKLRLRIAVATIAVAVPLVVSLIWLDARARHRAAAELLLESSQRRLRDGDESARCDADPAAWGGRLRPPGPPPGPPMGPPPGPPPGGMRGGAPPEYHALDADLHPFRDGAASVPSSVRGELAADGAAVIPTPWWEDDVEVVFRWGDGRCAYVYAHGTTTRGWIGSVLPANEIWLLPLAGVLLAVLIAVGPVVQRIRRLTRAVESAAPIPVEGRDEIAELARAFDAARRDVHAREKALRDFLANTTHDVMIPLTVLQAHLASLRDAHDPAVVVQAMDEAHYLGALVGNLAIAARLDAGEPELSRAPVDLGALVARVVARHRPIATQREVTIEHAVPESPLTTDADVTLLEQAVSNVVYNAVRHNQPGGHVAVILEARGAGFSLRIFDDCPGIPDADLARLVERGFRGDAARTREPGGQGLGLHIAFRVATLHGLDLRFGRSEHGGLEVTLANRGSAEPEPPAR